MSGHLGGQEGQAKQGRGRQVLRRHRQQEAAGQAHTAGQTQDMQDRQGVNGL